MASGAQTGFGAVLSMNPDSTVATATEITSLAVTAISEVVSIDPSFSLGEADVTHLGSAGLSDYLPTKFSGTIGFTMNFKTDAHVGVLATPAAAAVLAAQYSRRICAFKLAFPANTISTSAPDNFWFKGFFTECSPSLGTDDGNRATCSIRISDSAIVTAAA